MRWLGRFVKRLLLWGFGLIALGIVVATMFGPRQAPMPPLAKATPAPAPAAVSPKPTPKPAEEQQKPPLKPEQKAKCGEAGLFAPTYLVGDVAQVLVWRDGAAMRAGSRLILEGIAGTRPDLIVPYLSCFPNRGTRVTVVNGGMFSSTILVVEGKDAGCRGDVDNVDISKCRTSKGP